MVHASNVDVMPTKLSTATPILAMKLMLKVPAYLASNKLKFHRKTSVVKSTHAVSGSLLHQQQQNLKCL